MYLGLGFGWVSGFGVFSGLWFGVYGLIFCFGRPHSLHPKPKPGVWGLGFQSIGCGLV